MYVGKKYLCGLLLGTFLLSPQLVFAAPGFLLSGEVIIAQRTADVTGDKVMDQIYLIGKNEAKSGLNKAVNIVVEDGAIKEISRSLFSSAEGYRGSLEIGDFNGDKINDVMFTLQKSDLSAKTYIVAFNQATPQVIFQSEDDKDEVDVRNGEVTITPDDHGKTIHVKKDSTVHLQLPENPSTGYTWQFTQSTGGEFVAFLGQQNLIPNDEPQMAGKPGIKVFSFKTQKKGTLEMSLANYRIWEGTETAVDHFQVTIQIVE